MGVIYTSTFFAIKTCNVSFESSYLILVVTGKPQAIISDFITSGKLSLLNYRQETVFYSVIKIEIPQISLYILTICIFMIVV